MSGTAAWVAPKYPVGIQQRFQTADAAPLIDKLFERFGQHLEAEGYLARGGQIIDATIVSVPKQRNTKEENEAIKAGKTAVTR